ncbi:glycoside hydrolase family protein [Rhodobacter sp. CCP-1]|uniref:Lysozyme n=2 Tax=Paragemmobacter ruber TaxID=1985673 RepID=A0ABW9Y0C4_9RHOB|nr:glycoside hydrolase family protein [Rhodobacter ruber]
MFVAVVLSAVEVFLAFVSPDLIGLPPGVFAALAGLVTVAAMVARLVVQRSLRAFLGDDDGAVSRRVAGVAGLGAALAAAVAIIAPWEGVELRAYRDIVGVPTICYGETRGVQMGDVATLEECQTMLARGVAEFERAIRPCLPAVLPAETRAAFISAAYNIGSAGFCRSSMSRRALAGDLRGACDALLMWNKAGGRVVRGLVNRRNAERALCLQGLGG